MQDVLRLRLAFALSGCSALVFQVVWFRKISLFLGATTEAASVTLAVFMLGLALGSYVAKPLLSFTRHPLVLLAGVELAIGAYGVFGLRLFDAAGAAYGHWATGQLVDEPARRILVRALVCAGGLIIPTTLMGVTFPVVLQGAAPRRRNAGSLSAHLYAANAAGAAAGALVTGFALIALCGLRGSTWVAAGLNGVAALLILQHARAKVSSVVAEKATDDEMSSSAEQSPGSRPGLLAVMFLVAGFSTFALETLWTRWLILVMGNSASAFALILFGFLAGIQFGSRYMARRVDDLDDPLATFGVVLMLVGVTALLTSTVIGALPIALDAAALDSAAKRAAGVFVAFLFVLAPAALGGATVSLTARELSRQGMCAAEMGRYYAVNTIGCVLGALVAGFLLPLSGLRMGIIIVAAIDVLVGFLVLLKIVRRPTSQPIGLAAAALGLAAILYLLPPPITLKLNHTTDELLYYSESSEASVAVVRNRQTENLSLLVHGDWQAGSGRGQEIHLRLLGHLPALFSRDQQEALVIGLGAGFTTGSVLAHQFARVTQVELSRSIPRASRFFDDATGRPLDDPRLRLIYDDGRNFLLTTNQSFDVITTDPIDPNDAGATSLYAREYYELVKTRLRPGGVAAQWLGLTSSLSDYKILLRTFQSVFPTTYLWLAGNTTVAIGFKDSAQVDRSDVEARLLNPRVQRSLARIDIRAMTDLLGFFAGSGDRLKHVIGPGPVNSDDFPLIEYSWSGAVDPGPFLETIVTPLLTDREKSVNSLFRDPSP